MPAHSFTALTPLAFLERASDVFADKTADRVRRATGMSYSEFGDEATRLARALQASGVQRGDRVAYMVPNIPEMLVANFGVPLAGAVLVAINTRLSAEEVHYICDHSGATVLVADTEYLPALAPVLDSLRTVREVIAVNDLLGPAAHQAAEPAHTSYDDFMKRGSGEPLPWTVEDEPSLISINYTSGTTGTAQGCDVHPPRRVPQCAGRGHPPALRPGERLPVDAADVPLQRLVHPVGGDRDRRDARVPAGGARRRDLAAARRGRRDPSRRRADSA